MGRLGRLLWCVVMMVVWGVFGSVYLLAQDVVANHYAAASDLTIGDLFSYEIAVTYNRSVQSVRVPTADVNWGDLSVRDLQVVQDQLPQDLRVMRLRYQLAAYKTGDLIVPTRSVRYVQRGEEREMILPAFSVSIQSLVASKPGISFQDIKASVSLMVKWWRVVLVAVVVVVLIAGALWWGLRWWRRRHDAVETSVPSVPVDTRDLRQIALDRLRSLKEAGGLDSGRIKDHYLGVSEILKGYLSGIYAVSLLDLTTEECLKRVKSQIHRDQWEMLKSILVFSDAVKFAKFEPASEDHDRIMMQCVALIDQVWALKNEISEVSKVSEE